MQSYTSLLNIIAPVFALFGLGVLARRLNWLAVEAEASLLKLIVNLLYPCLILRSVLGNAALREPANLLAAPLLGGTTLLAGMFIGLYAGRLLGLSIGHGLRTFAFAVGIYNYGYIPIPLIEALWGRETLGVLLVYNVGVELALWTGGILILSGLSLREGWRRLVNPVVISLIVGVVLNALHVTLPPVLLRVTDLLASCAVPLGLLSAGAAVSAHLKSPRDLWEPRSSLGACALRLCLIPLLFLALAKWGPFTTDLRRVLVVQASMPAGMLTLVIAGHYGGQPLVAARVIIATVLLGIFLIPLWLSFGLGWCGL